MEASAVAGQVVAAIGGLGGVVRLYRSRAHRIRSEIEANREFSEKFPEGSNAREKLRAYTETLVDAYITKELERRQFKRQWGNIITYALAAGGLGFWATQVTWIWFRAPLWALAVVFCIATLGSLTPPKRSREEPSTEIPVPAPRPNEVPDGEALPNTAFHSERK